MTRLSYTLDLAANTMSRCDRSRVKVFDGPFVELEMQMLSDIGLRQREALPLLPALASMLKDRRRGGVIRVTGEEIKTWIASKRREKHDAQGIYPR